MCNTTSYNRVRIPSNCGKLSFERVIFRLLEHLKTQFFLFPLAVNRFDPEGVTEEDP